VDFYDDDIIIMTSLVLVSAVFFYNSPSVEQHYELREKRTSLTSMVMNFCIWKTFVIKPINAGYIHSQN